MIEKKKMLLTLPPLTDGKENLLAADAKRQTPTEYFIFFP